MKSAPIKKTVRCGALSLHIRRYEDGRYGFDYKPPGAKRVKVRLQGLADVEKRANELIGGAAAGRVERLEIDPDDYTKYLVWKAKRKEPAMISALVPTFLESREAKGNTIATVRELKSTLKPFAKAFPGPIADLQRDAVEKWLSRKPVSPRRWNNMRAAIAALHRFARHSDLLGADLTPVERIERRKVILNIETYSPEELRALIASVPERWLPLIVLGAFCGLRPEEISPDPRNGGWKPGLVWENILWAKNKVDVPAAVSKVRRRRFAPLTEAAAAFLEKFRDAKGPVVPRLNHHQISWEWAELAAEKCEGFRLKKNGLRHSFASYRLALTKDAPALALEMGNSPAMIFNHYLDLKHEDEAVAWFAIRPTPKVPIGPTRKIK